jgi:hypothetical protein
LYLSQILSVVSVLIIFSFSYWKCNYSGSVTGTILDSVLLSTSRTRLPIGVHALPIFIGSDLVYIALLSLLPSILIKRLVVTGFPGLIASSFGVDFAISPGALEGSSFSASWKIA